MRDSGPAGRIFYTTAQVCREVGVAPHVLKYWEKRMGLKFHRSGPGIAGGRRMFRAEDVAVLRRIALLLSEGYGLSGVRRLLRGDAQPELPFPPVPRRAREALRALRRDLERIRAVLEK